MCDRSSSQNPKVLKGHEVTFGGVMECSILSHGGGYYTHVRTHNVYI